MTAVVVDCGLGALRGRRTDGVTVFAGIPFAAPPVGELRFAPPQPFRAWSGVRDALEFAADPAQGRSALGRIERGSSAASGGGAFAALAALSAAAASRAWAEDCLYLNVWTPDPTGHRPVIVWIYGGGFEMGSAAPPMTDGAVLARATDCVVVAANYRVGALGFLHLADLGGAAWAGSTNLGLQDQAAALHWVQRTVAAFGGDPGRVTVAGESAGAFSIGALLAMPSAAGTFGQAILHSGSTQRIFPAAVGTAMAEDLLTALELDDLDGLRAAPAQRILDGQSRVIDSDIGRRNLPGGRSWGVVLDGVVVPEHPHEALAGGAARHVGLLVGANRDELRVFQQLQADTFRPADEEMLLAEMRRAGFEDAPQLLAAYRERLAACGAADDLAEARAAFLTDQIYREPATRMAAAQVAAGGRAWSFLFSDAPFGPAMGAFHAADQLYLFDQLAGLGIADPQRLAVRDALHLAWKRFAASGDPGWPVHDPTGTPATRQFGAGADLVSEPPRDKVTDVRERR